MSLQKGAVALTVDPKPSTNQLTARVPAGRSTNFGRYVDHYRKDNDEAYQEAQGFRPLPVSHKPHLPSQGSANRRMQQRAFAGTDPVALFWVVRIIGRRALVVNVRCGHTLEIFS